MAEVEPQPRPVVDTAAVETRTGRVIAAVAALFGALPAFLMEFGWITPTPGQIGQYGVMLGLVVGLALVLAGEKTKQNALMVEAQVTPIASPRLTTTVPLTPEDNPDY